jgi:hypothetical protein
MPTRATGRSRVSVAPDFGAGGLVRIRDHWRGPARRAELPGLPILEISLRLFA